MRKLRFFLTTLVLVISSAAYAQNMINISGVVSDSQTGEPVPFASIVYKGATGMSGVMADEVGKYLISAPSNAKLTFSAIGYADKLEDVNGRTIINVALSTDALALEDVVVVAYGTARRESITGSVSTVSSRSIEKRPVTSVVSALEGMTSGVQINNTNGEPGSTPNIRIRGFTTINGTNSPLYVVDGVPLSGSSADINMNDVESLTVLKDAASAALYGNRASNGVILITTKRGKSDRFSIRATMNQGLYTRGLPEYDRLNADEWMEVKYKGLYNSLLSTPANAGKYTPESAHTEAASQIWDLISYNIYNKPNGEVFTANGKLSSGAKVKKHIAEDLDWFKPIERLGHRQEYNVSGDGASEKSNYFFSVNYLSEDGYLTTSDFERFTARTNVSIQPKKWIKMGLNMAGSHRNSNFTSQSSSTGYANPFYFARNMSPIYPVHLHDLSTPDGDYMVDENGNSYDYGQVYTRPQNNARSVVYEGILDRDNYIKNTLDSRAFVDIMFLKGFTLSIKGNLYTSNSEERTYNNAIVGDGAGNHGRASREQYRYKNFNFQQHLTWEREFGDHSVDVLLGHENYSMKYHYLYNYKLTETFANKYDLVNFNVMDRMTDYENNYTTESYIARARYNYKNRYFADASFRRDGSSRFAESCRWGNFWSLGGSWIISREKWMENTQNYITDLKLRASYGEVGNDQSVGMYGWMALYTLTQNGQEPAAYKVQNEAKDIVWESANSLGIALEGRFFDRFNLSVEYFDKQSHDLLFDVNLPLSAGAESTGSSSATVTKNIGNISNRGWEFNFDIDLIHKKNFNWDVGLNATTLKNKILRLPEENRELGIVSGTKKYVEGGGIYDYWMYQFVGVDQMTGYSLYLIDDEKYFVSNAQEGKTAIPEEYAVTINGKDYTLNTSYAKKDWAGSAIPKIFGSFNTSLSYKNFSLSALFTYSLGGKTLDNSYISLMSVPSSPYAIHKDVLKAWDGVPAGMTETSADRIDPNGIPVIDNYMNSYTNATSSRFLQSSDYFVIKNLALSYRLPKTVCEKIDLSALNFTLSVENLATFTKLKGMDPQQSFNGITENYFSTARTFSLGVNITL